MKKLNIDNREIKNICNLYLDGVSAPKINKLYGISKTSIGRILKANNILARTQDETSRQHRLNINIFENIDTHEKAYWLGILAGDGCVGDEGHIILSMIDEEHIYKFRTFLGSSHPIKKIIGDYIKKDGTNSISYRISICNKKICSDLYKYNIRPRKTNNLTFPNNINEEYISSYLLGLLDSDGWFHINYKTKYPMVYIGFCGTYNMVKSVRDILVKNCNLNAIKIQPSKSIFAISYGGNLQGLRICKYLFNKCPMFLNRKKPAILKFLLTKYPNDEWLIKENYILAKKFVFDEGVSNAS